MTDAQLDMVLPDPQAAEWWHIGACRVTRRQRILPAHVVSDAVMLFDALIVLGTGLIARQAYFIVFTGHPSLDHGQYVLSEALAALLFAALCRQQQAYRLNRMTDLAWQLRSVAKNLVLAFAALALACFVTKISARFSRGSVFLWFGMAGATLALGRCAVALGVDRLKRAGHLRRRRAVIGEEPALGPVLDALQDVGEEPAELVCVLSRGREADPNVDPRGIGAAADLVAALRTLALDEIIVAYPDTDGDRLRPLINRLRTLPADVRVSLPAIARDLPVCGTSMVGALPVIDVAVKPLKYWRLLLKSTVDWSLALVLVGLLSPVFALIALLIKLDTRGPVLFVQDRFGFNNKIIRIIKFRTMHVEQTDPTGAAQTVRGDARITRIGRFLRTHSLDELPQLFNVLRGEMSLVGPRPHPLAIKAGDRLYHEAVSGYFARHRVKPGMTGWAQVNGLRGEICSLEVAKLRVDYDLYYIDNWSMWFDLRILFMSFKVVLAAENAF
jgi:Undecaprenyl-phosphate glucose phosphotransferase